MVDLTHFKPVKGNITLHGLGFIQLVVAPNVRIHVWHPDLPVRKHYQQTKVHNHRFDFSSTVMKGEIKNHNIEIADKDRIDKSIAKYPLSRLPSTYDEEPRGYRILRHGGDRLPTGSRKSEYQSGAVYLLRLGSSFVAPGETYHMKAGKYHYTECKMPTATLMVKTRETLIPARSLVREGFSFDLDFDRFQLSTDELFDYVKSVLF